MRRRTIGVLSGVALAALGVLAFIAVGASGASRDSNGSNVQSNSLKNNYAHDCTTRDAAADGQSGGSADGGGMQGDDLDNDGDTISFSGFKVLWPPNHKYRTVTITATDNGSLELPGMDYTTLDTMTTSNEPELGMGSGHTLNDADPAHGSATGNGSASVTIKLRGERAGKDPTHVFDGRTYTIRAFATYDGANGQANMMEHCNAQFTVRVPHDMGHG